MPLPSATVDSIVRGGSESGAVPKTSTSSEAGMIEKPKLPATGQTTYVNPENTPHAMKRKLAEKKKVN